MSMRAYLGNLQLGHDLDGPIGCGLNVQGAEARGPSTATRAGMSERGPGASYRLTTQVSLWREDTPGIREYAKGLVDFQEAVVSEVAANAFQNGAWLVEVLCPDEDETTIVAQATQGDDVTVTLTDWVADITVGRWVYLSDGNNHAVVQVESVDAAMKTFTADLPTTIAASGKAALVLRAWPECYITQGPAFEGIEPGSLSTAEATLEFVSVGAPVS